MNPNHSQYTFSFEKVDTVRFNKILERFDEADYTIVTPVSTYTPEDKRDHTDTMAVIEMDDDTALTLRLGMPNTLKIKKYRTEEEEAAKKALEDKHKVKITVYTGSLGSTIVPDSGV